jgi:DNA topoisomerase-1
MECPHLRTDVHTCHFCSILKKIEKKKEQISKKELQVTAKEDLKTVALGTSKINYMDPRISIAWCKRHEVPLEKVFNKSLLAKFNWAMEVEPEFRF